VKIQIVGSGCAKCKTLEANAREAVAKTGVDAEIIKITDVVQIAQMGVMSTPALAIDGEIRSVGKVLSVDQIAAQLKGAK